VSKLHKCGSFEAPSKSAAVSFFNLSNIEIFIDYFDSLLFSLMTTTVMIPVSFAFPAVHKAM